MWWKHIGCHLNLDKDNQGSHPVAVTSMAAYLQVKDKEELLRWGALGMAQDQTEGPAHAKLQGHGKIMPLSRSSRNLL